jgi:hypothetical protein
MVNRSRLTFATSTAYATERIYRGSTPMTVRGIENMTLGALVDQVKQGGRFVVFHWTIGLIFKTAQRPSPVYFLRAGAREGRKGFGRTLASLLTGWWAVPFGPIDTIRGIRENLRGGRDVTASVLKTLIRAEATAPASPPALESLTSTAA